MPESVLTKDHPRGTVRNVREITCPTCKIVDYVPKPLSVASDPDYFECAVVEPLPDGTVIKLWLCLNCTSRFWTKEKED